MTLRDYKSSDKIQCIAIFDSNCPKYFDAGERELFIKWLDHQGDGAIRYSSPTYSNSEKDAYYVIELSDGNVIGCGGFYVVKDSNEARLAWGMIHADLHNKGYGTALYKHRQEVIGKEWPKHSITLGTSQHTYAFYQKMGLNVTATIKEGYGPEHDRYDMQI
jgi:[ribosomal protein S18]-alanine N-acetyltransferase